MPIDATAAKSIFLAALDREDQSAFIDEACSGNPELRARVQALLEAHGAGSFPDLLAAGHETRTAAVTPDDPTRTGGTAAVEVPDLSFLESPREPGHLGRLDHYEVLSVIGQGGMGIVFRAHDESLDRVVAIKVLAPQYAANAAARKRFIREAKAVAAVVHEHVVAVHEVDDRVPYLVMQFIPGASLQDRIDRTGPLPVNEVLRIGMQIASGLAAAHKQGIVHRDIKPSNILLENGIERVKITDFGLARAVDDASVTQSGVIAGTPLFMSPEQARGEAVNPRSDLFSLGSVLYAMCTSHAPFRASGTMAVLRRVIEDLPRSPREVNPDVPGWLDAIILKLLEKDPRDRFPSADTVAELLAGHLAHLQHPDRAPRPAQVRNDRRPPAPKPRRRGVPWWVFLILALAVAPCLLVGLAFVGWLFMAEADVERSPSAIPTAMPDEKLIGPPGEGWPPKDPDLERFQGTWRAVSGELDGRPATADELKGLRLSVTGDQVRYTLLPRGNEGEGNLTPYGLPHWKGVHISRPDRLGLDALDGTYRFDGDRLILCIGPPGTQRPMELATVRGGAHVLLTFEREPAAKKPFALDRPKVLDHMVGTWETRPADGVRARTVVQPVAGGRFVRVRTRLAGGRPGDDGLGVIGFDAEKWEFRYLALDSHGRVLGPLFGRFNEGTRTLMLAGGVAPGAVVVKTMQFPTVDEMIWEVEARDPAGRLVTDPRAVWRRVAGPTPMDEPLSPDRPKEMAVLDRLVGTWDQSWSDRLNPDDRWTAMWIGASVVGGRYIEVREHNLSTGEEGYFVYAYDPTRKAYRQWQFSSRGSMSESLGRWDEDAKTMRWTVESGPHKGWRTTWTMISSDRIEASIEVRDKDGKLTRNLDGTFTRRKGLD